MPSFAALVRVLAIAGVATASNLAVRADEYTWKLTWTGPETCPEVPCPYSYEVSGPRYSSPEGSIPSFTATCEGTVDEPLKACELGTHEGASEPAISGNFSTYETSGVGPGQIIITATWFEEKYNEDLTLTGVSPMQASEENQGTWDLYPGGCPLTDCPGTSTSSTNATAPTPRRRAAWRKAGKRDS
ncbi:hypothetical protein F5X99DRAFT_401701 [Biscogniauxia marginata]|nr:hypothetical protein F5X99DRAFT_401701 [Biscogniauxia marginata]